MTVLRRRFGVRAIRQPRLRVRMRIRSATLRARAASNRWGRDGLALAGVGCVAIGLATVSVALAWVAVGAYLLIAAGTGRKGA